MMDKGMIIAIAAAVALTALAVGIPAYTVGKNSTPANSEYYDSCELLSEYGGRIYYNGASYYTVPVADKTSVVDYDYREKGLRANYDSYHGNEWYYSNSGLQHRQYSQEFVRNVSVHVVGNSLHIEITNEKCSTTAVYSVNYPAGGPGPYSAQDCYSLLAFDKITTADITGVSFERTSEFTVHVSEIPLSSVSIMNVNSVPKEASA